MKKWYLISIFLINSAILFSNPVYMPEMLVLEFKIISDQEWEMIIWQETDIDSFQISSSKNKSTFVSQSGFYYIITNDSLRSNVYINPEGDSVTIMAYCKNWYKENDTIIETIVFGNYPNASIPKPSIGQSIIRILWEIEGTNYHCLIDSDGNRRGTITGKLYDNSNNLITSGSFFISSIPDYESGWDYYTDNCFDVNLNGTYNTSLYSVIHNIDSIYLCNERFDDEYFKANRVKIAPLNLVVRPDDIINIDIHLIDDLVEAKEIKIKKINVLEVFPNPINNYFNYKISIPVKSTNSILKLVNINGQNTWEGKIIDNTGTIHLPSNISHGIYFLQLWVNGNNYSSVKLAIE